MTDDSKREDGYCKVAIVGAGYMAREHIRAFQAVPGVEIVGIHSRTEARAAAMAAEFSIPVVYHTVADMFSQSGARLVVVTVPELQANDVCRACFEHPWTLLVEKPAGYNVEDATSIAAAARAKGRRVYVALNRRHYASTIALLDDLKNFPGRRLIKVQDQEDMAAAVRAGQPPLVVENWMYANSIHLIDYFTLLGRGSVLKVERTVPWHKNPGYVAATLTFESGDVGLYEAIWDGPGPWAVTVNTPGKRWELRPLERAFYQLAGSRTLEPIDGDPTDVQFKPGLRRQAELAVRAAMGLSTHLPTLDDALASMRLAQAIYS